MKTPRLTLALTLFLAAAPAAETPTIADVMLDQMWYGEEVTNADLEGRVVLLELWGIT